MNKAVYQRLSSLSDPARTRLLQVLERHELTVSELVAVVQLPQSTVSRHLKVLSDEGWVAARADGTSRYYRVASRLEEGARRLWEVVREAVAESAEARQDGERAVEVLARRRSRSQEFFATAAGQWESVRSELFGERPELRALGALLDPSWEVGDLGCGTGQVTEAVAPYVRRVVAVDESGEMLDAGRRRLEGLDGAERVDWRRGRLEALPVEGASLDVAVLSLVLHYVPAPERVLAEAHRVLRPGGRVVVVDMVAHGRSEYRERMGHLWQGFEASQVEEWLEGGGFAVAGYRHLAVDPTAKGPLLFVARGVRR